MRLANHAEKRAGGIGVREDDVGAVAAAVDGAHASCRPVLNLDLGDLTIGRDLDPVLTSERRYRFGNTAHAAAHEAPSALMPADTPYEVMEFHIRGAGRHRTGVDPNHPTGGEGSLDLLGLKVTIQKLGDALVSQGSPVLLPLRSGEARFNLIPRWGWLQQQRPHSLQDAVPHRPVGVVASDVTLREFCDLLSRLAPVKKAHEIRAVGKGDEVLRIEGAHVVAVPLQLEVRDDLGQQQIADV